MSSTRIKVMLATNIMGLGGAERTVQTVARYLNKEQFDVTVLCMEAGGGRVEELVQAGVRVLVGDGSIESIKKLCQPGEVDVLHLQRSGHMEPLHTAVVEYLKPKKMMEVNIFAFTDPVLGPRFDLQIYKSMMMLTERIWKGKIPRVINPWLRERVIYNPVTVNYFDAFKLSKEEIIARRSALGLKPNDFVLGRIGRNDPVKWGDLILSALPALVQKIPQVKFVFRTLPTARLTWLKKCGYLDRVVVLPETNNEAEIAATYQLLDVYVHPSRRGEAFGNTLNEAMVWSLPIVVENTPHWDNGQLEQVDHGKTGWVVSTVSGLVSAIEDLAKDRDARIAFGRAGRKKVVEFFDLTRGVTQYELAYRQLMGLIDEKDLATLIFPSAETILSFPSWYQHQKKIDITHPSQPFWEVAHFIAKWRWRLNDSLTARGFIKGV